MLLKRTRTCFRATSPLNTREGRFVTVHMYHCMWVYLLGRKLNFFLRINKVLLYCIVLSGGQNVFRKVVNTGGGGPLRDDVDYPEHVNTQPWAELKWSGRQLTWSSPETSRLPARVRPSCVCLQGQSRTTPGRTAVSTTGTRCRRQSGREYNIIYISSSMERWEYATRAGLHDHVPYDLLPRWQKVCQSRATEPRCTDIPDLSDLDWKDFFILR